MKVLELVLKWAGGGVERYVEDLARAANAEGIVSHVASVTSDVNCPDAEAFGPLVEGGVKGALLQRARIEAFIREGAYNVVHIHGNNGLVFLFAHVARKAGAAAIVHSHNSSFGDGSKGAKALFTSFERRMRIKDCEVLLACSRAAGDFLFAGSNYTVAFNGINIVRFAFDDRVRSEMRGELGISEGVPVVGFAATFIDAKNPFFALDIFRDLLNRFPEARFVACGDGELLEAFKVAAKDLLSNGACVCPGRVSDIERYYCAMDVLLAPSKYEGLPINLIEAQACGLPIVMSDGITDEVVIVPGACERLGLNSEVRAWTDAVAEILEVGSERSISSAGSVRAAAYSSPECFGTVFDKYREVAKR